MLCLRIKYDDDDDDDDDLMLSCNRANDMNIALVTSRPFLSCSTQPHQSLFKRIRNNTLHVGLLQPYYQTRHSIKYDLVLSS